MGKFKYQILFVAALVFLVTIFFNHANDAQAESLRTTYLFSKNINGGVPNGNSRHAAISHDQRIARIIAYESDASDLVNDDTNNITDIFMVNRQSPWGVNGTFWTPGKAIMISRGIDGTPANGPSSFPVIDGDSHNNPKCVAFLSKASNLVPNDTNNLQDAFLYYVPTSSITRISLDSNKRQINQETTNVSIDGDCERVAFTINNTIYLKIINAKKKIEKHFKNNLIKIDKGSEGYLARSGKAIAYTKNNQIYRAEITRVYKRNKKGKGKQVLVINNTLVTKKNNKPGNGRSYHPSITDNGRYISFVTNAKNLIHGVQYNTVMRADLRNKKKPVFLNASKSIDGLANNHSYDPVISDAGEFILYTSDATNLRPSLSVNLDPNNITDLILWNKPTMHTSLESRNWNNKYIYDKPSFNPATSSRGNYVLFESSSEELDASFTELNGTSQVYMRYLGPK